MVKTLSAMWETWVSIPGREEPLKEGMASHSGILLGESPWTEEPWGLAIIHGFAKSWTWLSNYAQQSLHIL